jgi:transposase
MIEEQKDVTLDEMVTPLAAQVDLSIGRSASSVWLRRRGWTFEKDRTCIGAKARRRLKRRRAWFDGQLDLDPAKLVLIDETRLSTKMACLRGRVAGGERCRAAVPQGHWKTTAFTGALRLTGMTAPTILGGPMNESAFRAYVEQGLVPTLASGDTTVMDNQPALKAEGVRLAIEKSSAELHYLPTYSPDFNPIEIALSELKALLRSRSERTFDGLWDAVGAVIPLFELTECANYFAAAFYKPD